MKISSRILAPVLSVGLACSQVLVVGGHPAGAAAGNMKFCESMSVGVESMMISALLSAFTGFAGEEVTPEPGELSPVQASSVLRLILAPKTGQAYLAAAKNAPKGLGPALTKIGTQLAASEKILKKAGLNDRGIRALRTLDITSVDPADKEPFEAISGKKLSKPALLNLGKAAETWAKASDRALQALERDKKLQAIGDRALAACTPTDARGKAVTDACELLSDELLAAALPDADRDSAEADDEFPLVRSCDLESDSGSLSIAVTTPKRIDAGTKSLGDVEKVKGVGSSAVIADGSGSTSMSHFSGSSSGKMIWVKSGSTGFSLSYDPSDPETSQSVDVPNEKMIALAKLIAKQLRM